MSRTWTDNQLRAINTTGGSLVVSAAAGSGKTSVLVERVINLISDESHPLYANRLLVVTYTRAAAAELKERLKKAVADLIEKNPTNRFYIKQQSLLEKANISTIHSFCSSIVREYFHVLDIDRNFRIADDSELAIIKNEAVKLTLDSMYSREDKKFHELVEAFSTAKDDSLLQKNILKIFDFLSSHPFYEEWLNEKLSYYISYKDPLTSAWGSIINNYLNDAINYMKILLDSGFKTINLDENLSADLAPVLEDDLNLVEKLDEAVTNKNWDKISSVLYSYKPTRFKTPSGYKDNPLKITVQSNREKFKDIINELKKLFLNSEADCKEDIEYLKIITEQMFICVKEFAVNYSMLKANKKVADYSDLEHWMLSLLINKDTKAHTEIASEIQQRFDQIMVDEYQDANEVQDKIFKAISNDEKNLFVVGDVKQSIYGFRQAMPELFLQRKNNANLASNGFCKFPACIILEKNFRSAKGITKAVNYFFEKLMSKSVGDIEYNEAEALVYGAKYDDTDEAAIELDLLETEKKAKEASVQEAQYIAERIWSMIGAKYQVKSGDQYRDCTFSDFAVLMRSANKYAPIYVETLNRCGIRAYSDKKYSFIKSHEIMLISNFLRVINNPGLDLELLSVMMCPVFAFDEDDLSRIRINYRNCSLYSGVIMDAENGNKKSKLFVDEIKYYRDLSISVSLSKLIDTIYKRSNFMAIISAMYESELPTSNLRLFLKYAADFEKNTHKGLSGFVSYLDGIVLNDKDIGSAGQGSNLTQNAVAVMSIHSSKGLEFPICIIANTKREFVSDIRENVLLDSKFGFAVKRLDQNLGAAYNTMPRQAIALEMKRREKSEELRILYVAMTRAKQKLIIISTHNDVDKYLNKISSQLANGNQISAFTVRSAGYLSDWIVMCAMLHPDCEMLRNRCNNEVEYDAKSDFKFDCKIIKLNEENNDIKQAFIETIAETEISQLDSVAFDLDITKIIEEHSAFEYPYKSILSLPVKVAASDLAHKISNRKFERILDTPAFMQKENLTSAEKGTALHNFMQFTDFVSARKDLISEIARLTNSGFLSEIQAQSIDIEKAKRFIDSDIITRCINSEQVYKEYRFTVKIPAALVQKDIDPCFSDEPVILQGAVDLAFVENGKLIIVDYKTDRVNDIKSLVDIYASQLLLYKKAMIQCTGLEVSQCLIYSVNLSKSVEVIEK